MVCKYEDCEKPLQRNSRTGYCGTHRHLHYREQRLAYYKKRRVEKKAEIALYQKLYRAKNKKKIAEYNRNYQISNPEIFRSNSQKRRALKKEAFVEEISLKVVWDRDLGICHICSLPADVNNWHLEHKIPLSKGGLHSYDNVGVAHPLCNMKKHDSIL